MANCKVKSNITSNEITSVVLTDILTKQDSETIRKLWDFIIETSNNIEELKIKLLTETHPTSRNIVLSQLNRQNNVLWTAVLTYATNSPIYKNIFLDMLSKKYGWVLGSSSEVIKFIDKLWTEWARLWFNPDDISEQTLNSNLYKQIFIQAWFDGKYVNKNRWDIVEKTSNILKNKAVIDYYYAKEYGFNKLIADIWAKKYKEMAGKVWWMLKKAWIESNEFTDWWAIINKIFNDDLAQVITKEDTVETAIKKLDGLMNKTFGTSIKDDYLTYLVNDLNRVNNVKAVLNSDIMFKYSLYKQLNSWVIDIDWMYKILDAMWVEWVGDWYKFLDKEVDDILDASIDDVTKDFWINMNKYDSMSEAWKVKILNKYKDFLETKKIKQAYELANEPGLKKQLLLITKMYNNIIQWLVKIDIKDLPNLIKREIFRNKAQQYALKYGDKSDKVVVEELIGFIDSISAWKAFEYLQSNKLAYLSEYLKIWDLSEAWIVAAYNNKFFEILNMVGVYNDYLDKIFDNTAFVKQLDSFVNNPAEKSYYLEKISAWKEYVVKNELSGIKMKDNSIEEILKKLWDKRPDYVNWLTNILRESVIPVKPGNIDYVLSVLWGGYKIKEADKYIYVTYAKNYEDVGQELKDITVNSFRANTLGFPFEFSFDSVVRSDDEINALIEKNKWQKLMFVFENAHEWGFPLKWTDDFNYVEPREWLSFKLTEDRTFQVQWLDELSLISAQKSLWNVEWIRVNVNDVAQQKVLDDAINKYLDIIWVEDKKNYIMNAEKILWGRKLTYNFKEFQKRIDLYNKITNWTIIKQYINPLDVRWTIATYIDNVDREWLSELADNMMSTLWIDAPALVKIQDREVIKDLLYRSVVGNDIYAAKIKLLDYL